MNPLNVLRDSLYFFSRHFLTIVRLCLPLVVLEAFCKEMLDHAIGPNGSPVYDIVLGLLFYPIYTAGLILFLDAKSHGTQPKLRNLLAMAMRLWPMFALLTGISTVAILVGMSMFVLPGLWIMVKVAFAEYFLVLRHQTPLGAIRDSAALTRGHFWRIMACLLAVLVPLWLLQGVSTQLYPESTGVIALTIDSANSFLQLFTSVVVYRLFMLLSESRTAPVS